MPTARRLPVTPILARRQATGERTPYEHSHAGIDDGGQQLHLDVAERRAVEVLRHDERRQVFARGDPQRLHHLPRRVVRAAEVADLSLLHEIAQRTERLFQRRQAIPGMNLIEVDVLSPEIPEAAFAL